MRLADGLRKHGFRKWYERELLQSHAHLALCFICSVGLFAAFEALVTFRSWSDQVTDLLAILICAGVGLWALRRYLYLLMHAESVANQAECAQCGTYGRLQLVQPDARGEVLAVRCNRCAHEWRIES